MCELRNHITRVMSSAGAVRPVPIVQNIRGKTFLGLPVLHYMY